MPRCARRIGAPSAIIAWPEHGNRRRASCYRQMHDATVVANEQSHAPEERAQRLWRRRPTEVGAFGRAGPPDFGCQLRLARCWPMEEHGSQSVALLEPARHGREALGGQRLAMLKFPLPGGSPPCRDRAVRASRAPGWPRRGPRRSESAPGAGCGLSAERFHNAQPVIDLVPSSKALVARTVCRNLPRPLSRPARTEAGEARHRAAYFAVPNQVVK